MVLILFVGEFHPGSIDKFFEKPWRVFAYDTARDSWADLRVSTPFGLRLLEAARAGAFAAVIAMPACDTFSRALGRPLPGGRPGPPVVRSFEEPYGIARKMEDPNIFSKVTEANECHLFAIAICGWVVMLGGLALYEQPEPWEGTVSVFDWQEFRDLQEQSGGDLYRTNQGCFGAPSIKPTALWASFLLSRCIDKRLIGGALPQVLASGEFGTSPAKAYPPAFSAAIVADLTAAWELRRQAVWSVLPLVVQGGFRGFDSTRLEQLL